MESNLTQKLKTTHHPVPTELETEREETDTAPLPTDLPWTLQHTKAFRCTMMLPKLGILNPIFESGHTKLS